MTDRSRRSGGPGAAIVVGTFMTMLAISIPNAYGPAVPGVSAASGVGVATVGQLTTVHGLGAFVGLMGWIWLSRRYPTRRLVTASVATLGVGVLTIALNPVTARVASDRGAFVVLVASVAVVGVAFSVTMVATNTVLANRGASAGLLNAANGMYGVGAVVLPLVVGAADLRTAAFVTVGLAVTTLPALRAVPDLSDELRASAGRAAVVRGERRAGSGRAGSGRARTGLRARGWLGPLAERLWRGNGSRPWVWLFSVAIGVEIGTAAWAATHLVSLGVDEGRAATAVAGFFAAFTLARFVMGAVGDRWSPRAVVVCSNLVAATAAVASTVVPRPSLAWAFVGLGVGPVFGTTLAWLTRATGDPDGTRRMNVGGAFGAVLLPGLIGVLVGVAGPGVIPWAVAAYATAAAGVAATLPKADDQRPSALGAATSTHT